MSYYAVQNGRNPGIYGTWSECETQVKGFKGAKFKKFGSLAEAKTFIGPALASKLKDQINQVSANVQNNPKASKTVSTSASRKRKADDGHFGPTNGSSSFKVPKLDEVVPRRVVQIARSLKASDYQLSGDDYIICYTDGSCVSNGSVHACAGLGVWFGPEHKMNISEPVTGRQTNNRAEILAVVFALEAVRASGHKKLEVRIDSKFTIDCMTKWMPNWKRNGWKTATGQEVKNKEELMVLDEASKGMTIRYVHVAGHSGNVGNDAADFLAREGGRKAGAL